MSDVVANVSKGEVKGYARLDSGPADAFVAYLLKASGLEADAALVDHDTVAAVLAANDEADFTNYARKTVTALTITIDDTTDRVDVDMADQTWTAAGGAVDNVLGKLGTAFDPDTGSGTDAELVPQTFHDFAVATDGSDLTAQVAAGGFYRAA